MPGDAQPPPLLPAFGDCPKNAGSQSEVPQGRRGHPGESHRSEGPCCGVEGGSQGSANPIMDTHPQKGCFRAQPALLGCFVQAQPGGGTGTCPPGSRTDFPRCTQMDSTKPSIQQSRVSVTVFVRLLGWSPMRRVIPKLFLITFSIGGE